MGLQCYDCSVLCDPLVSFEVFAKKLVFKKFKRGNISERLIDDDQKGSKGIEWIVKKDNP